jgi:cyclic beta-1,2-glucan synthetase
VYTAENHLGRGGWTWYTGSASWMYRVGLEGILGFTRRGDTLFLEPRTPAVWREYAIEYRYGRSLYSIKVHNEDGGENGDLEVTIDGRDSPGGGIPLLDDGERHQVVVRVMSTAPRRPRSGLPPPPVARG